MQREEAHSGVSKSSPLGIGVNKWPADIIGVRVGTDVNSEFAAVRDQSRTVGALEHTAT
jgi:hypothetical protein